MDRAAAELALADYVVATCGEDLARDVFGALAEPDFKQRAAATTGLYWQHDRAAWPRLDDVLRLHRFEVTRRAVVLGLARRLGYEPPRLVETDREVTRRRTRDAALTKAQRHFGDVPGAGGRPTHKAVLRSA